jgi:hypothetical protein
VQPTEGFMPAVSSSGPAPQPQSTNTPSKTNTMAVWGLVLAFFIPILGLILSIVAKSQIKKSGESGNGLATAGIIISSIHMVVALVSVIMIMVLAVTNVQSKKHNGIANSSTSSSSLSSTNTSSYSADEKKAVTNAEAFLRTLSKNDKAGAYLILSPEFRAQLTRSEFNSKIENSNLKITGWNITSVSTDDSGNRITVKGTLDLSPNAKNGEFELTLHKGTDASIGIIQFDLHSN